LFKAAAKFAFQEMEYYFGSALNSMESAFIGFVDFVATAMATGGLSPLFNKLLGTNFHISVIPFHDFTGGGQPTFQNPFSHSHGGGRGFGVPHTQFGSHGGRGNAAGGIVTAPIMSSAGPIGEAGDEAIIPLGRGGMTIRIVDSNLDLVMSGVLEDDKAFAARGGRAQR
jgi:hypothetical protein